MNEKTTQASPTEAASRFEVVLNGHAQPETFATEDEACQHAADMRGPAQEAWKTLKTMRLVVRRVGSAE